MNVGNRILMLLCAALALGGCALGVHRLQPGTSTETDVRAALGEPAAAYTDAKGSRTLVFPTGPEGTRTYMTTLGADGRLTSVEQVLEESRLRRISAGSTTTPELERLIGPPWRNVDFPNLRQVAWDYVILDSWGYTVDFSVMVDERGIVAGTVYARRDTGDGGMK